ncbi:hypothetical protein ASD50_19585 [Mesorhizobium sp. Root552]|uniref:class I SAM-dependent methyltransferase n=1 Tax=Mesorhizobium sp. Root552 TaxID=1736555 RepID=UPI0006FBAA21|nr:class I SAM-dependent methyltransferase [Mesorhizobium sp. Root552]KQZ28525.1 hypothetical protein ASD50_19585 [Mesorhizobium sp. Root552]
MNRVASLQDIHSYWKKPNEDNAPETYTKGAVARSLFLLDCIKKYATPRSRILELGCNAGRNMAFLHNAGFTRLTAIEINANAIDHMRHTFPELKRAKIIISSIEDSIRQLPGNSFNIIYTMAVLEHVHPDSNWIFAEMARVSPKIITVEDEVTESPRHFKRDYRTIFQDLGYKQIELIEAVPGMTRGFRYRCFARKSR